MDDLGLDMGGSDSPESEWDRLSSEDRKELLKAVFADGEWYDGPAYHEGGAYHPAIGEIASKLGCRSDDIKMYYAAWLQAKGFTKDQITEAIRNAPKTNSFAGVTPVVSPLPESVKVEPSNAYKQQMQKMESEAFSDPSLDNGMYSVQGMPKPPGGDSVSNSMSAMMQFMMMQQQIAARQQHQAQMMQMEQRRLDQQRESELRREQQARDQQFSMQQMSFMREMMRTKDSDGFFDSDMKGIFKQKMVENLLDGGGGGSESALERVAGKLLQPEILGAVATGASAALAKNQPVRPAGYDSPNYDPYAGTPVAPTPSVANYAPPQAFEPEPMVTPSPEPTPSTTSGASDLFFGDEGVEENTPEITEQEILEMRPQPAEYKNAIMEQLKANMGPELEDPKKLEAVQQQVSITVDNILIEYSNYTVEQQLQEVAKRITFIRSIRDIAQGLEKALLEVQKGTSETVVVNYIIGQLKENPVFWEIFSKNNYTELMGIIQPFVETGGVKFDYQFLSRPEVAALCTTIITQIQSQ
ncbi:MAG: hypothetical protein CBB67_004385 [Alteromonadaceae bacterium TMED7]|uniref:hypothetical protein n=1 Tax=Alteromonas sp. TaxID=232 RepID=UPI000B723B28|nr:hypothetical protein [Alteromonas sp.]MAI37400.1 hypothetical protein [Alteromonas sp.]RPH21047.1 MAG: hypothetical protein CBB67_004385 [Alteromonadaceae bacterium TMED7]|tara:strand:- start:8628 stop:10208 length:1581 start_codon:yes stop_codon:yes gene_type:complete